MNVIWLVFVGGAAIIAGTLYIHKYEVEDTTAAIIYKITNSVPITEWEHGMKTSRVIATRYKNDSIGYNIGFTFPLNPDDCDNAKLSEFIESKDGWVFQGGGYAGAELYAKFKDVNDRVSADKKLREILPELSQLITDLGNGKTVKINKTKPEYEWPNTAPPDKTDPYWESSGVISMNGTQYMKKEVEPGKWQWVIDEKAMQSMANFENDRRKLFQALQTRVLTDDEMRQVLNYGKSLNVENNVPYSELDKERELNEAFLQQQRLRLASPPAAKSP